jgi:hypothetical protein
VRNYKILHGVVQRLSERNHKISQHHYIFKKLVKQKNELNKTCRHVHDHLLGQTLFVWVQKFMSCLCETKYEF